MLRTLVLLAAATLGLTLLIIFSGNFFQPPRQDNPPDPAITPPPRDTPIEDRRDDGAAPADEPGDLAAVNPGPPVGEIVDPADRNVTPPEILPGPVPDGPMVRAPGFVPKSKPPQPEIRTHPRVIVVEAGRLTAKNTTVRLAGIKATPLEEICKDSRGRDWPCGRTARAELMRLIRARSVTCNAAPGTPKEDYAAECQVGPTSINLWLVEQGWATPAADAPETLLKAAETAKQQKRGIHREIGLGNLR